MVSQKRKRTKIVLDADVIIHFEKGGHFSTLLDIFPEYEYIVLDVVQGELRGATRQLVENYETMLKKLRIVKFEPTGDSRRDYALLMGANKGAGESASMIYCRDNRDVLGSSNRKDILEYCKENDITYLSTLDFLYYAFTKRKMTREECNECISTIKSKNSKLPEHITDIAKYVCDVEI